MSNYRRPYVAGGTYFITQVTYQRVPWLCRDIGRQALREALLMVKERYPFSIEAIVLLPEHFHFLLTLPENDADFSVRLRLIKTYVTKQYGAELKIERTITQSRQKRREGNLWKRRYWEHLIRNEKDFAAYCDYIHYNPVHHGLCDRPQEWKYSSVHRFVAEGIYPPNWCQGGSPEIPHGFMDK